MQRNQPALSRAADDLASLRHRRLDHVGIVRPMGVSAAEGGRGGQGGEEASGPSEAVIREAQRLRPQAWAARDPFAGESWLGAAEPSDAGEFGQGHGVLRATSHAAGGWRAVVGDEVVRVGDEFLGGKIVSISDGEVVVRGPTWQKVLTFSDTGGK